MAGSDLASSRRRFLLSHLLCMLLAVGAVNGSTHALRTRLVAKPDIILTAFVQQSGGEVATLGDWLDHELNSITHCV